MFSNEPKHDNLTPRSTYTIIWKEWSSKSRGGGVASQRQFVQQHEKEVGTCVNKWKYLNEE